MAEFSYLEYWRARNINIHAEEAIGIVNPNLGYNAETSHFRKDWR
jgi:hypothetical protein